MHSLCEVRLHCPSTISVRQPDVMSTWNELLRRFRCVRSPLTWYINFSFVHLQSGMWSRSRRLGLETVSRRTNVSSWSRLGQSAQRLGLGPVRLGSRPKRSRRLVSGLGPFRLVETFHTGAPCKTSVLRYKPVCLSP